MLSTIYALLCIIVPCSLYQLIICKRQNKKQENKAIHFVWVYIFLLYIYLTFSVAGIGSIWDIGHYDTIIRLEEINLLISFVKNRFYIRVFSNMERTKLYH